MGEGEGEGRGEQFIYIEKGGKGEARFVRV